MDCANKITSGRGDVLDAPKKWRKTMKILAIDSTAKVASVAICDNETPIATYSVNAGLNHSETLLPMVVHALETAKMTIDDIDLFALSAGPGSFTGVRIGTSVIKGLAFGKDKPCVPVSTLTALAYNMKGFRGFICPVMDARRDQVYNAVFYGDGEKITRIKEDRAIALCDLEKELANMVEEGTGIYFCGDGYDLATEKINNDNIRTTPVILRDQNAYSVACIALKTYNNNPNGDYTDSSLKPVYLRLPQAERERLERLNKEE